MSCVPADPRSSGRISGRTDREEKAAAKFGELVVPCGGAWVGPRAHLTHRGVEGALGRLRGDADTGAQSLSRLETPNPPMVWAHSLESKLISHSDLLYLNKSHVPAAT